MLSQACTTGESYADIKELKSPFFDASYPNNQVCKWSIQYREAVHLKFTFKVLDLGKGDEIVINEKIAINNQYPKNSLIINKPIAVCFSGCSIVFRSDRQFTGKGFYMEINVNHNIFWRKFYRTKVS